MKNKTTKITRKEIVLSGEGSKLTLTSSSGATLTLNYNESSSNSTLSFPQNDGTIVTTGDYQTVSNRMIENSYIIINGVKVDLGKSVEITGISDETLEELRLRESLSNKNQPNGYAGLDATGFVREENLPPSVFNVIEYDSISNFPLIGKKNTIYYTLDTKKIYHWTGSEYYQFEPSIGKSAYDVAVEQGFVGTVDEWLISLRGASAYKVALANGYVGTEQQWLDSLKPISISNEDTKKVLSNDGEKFVWVSLNEQLNDSAQKITWDLGTIA